ncbi:sulfurtransferase complex subunit TusB [Nitrincola sp. MINF-07-Sa-05]|uniref:sulfurtransferase complex subunit TusB n=1 Tax=Nitrincola salilacus TaxID=3400273 RepID=UPI003917DE01
MPTLHTLNRGPSHASCLTDCLSAMTDGDTLLLIEDGVYWILPGHVGTLKDVKQIHLLQADMHARGLQGQTNLDLVDDEGFVALCTEHDRVVSWF